MPKLKSHSGAKKRFKLTANGKIKRSHSLHNHLLTKKSQARKRRLRQSALVSKAMQTRIRRILTA